MATMSNCQSIVTKLADSDRDAVLSRLAEYQQSGIPVTQAQRLAVADVLAEVRQEHADLEKLAREQHPDAFPDKATSIDPVVSADEASTNTPQLTDQAGDGKDSSTVEAVSTESPKVEETVDEEPTTRYQRILDTIAGFNTRSAFLNNVKNTLVSGAMARQHGETSIFNGLQTQFHKAMQHPAFKRVFDIGQKFIEDTSLFANRAEEKARTIFPEAGLSIKALRNTGLSEGENIKVGRMLSEGTLDDGGLTDQEMLDTKLTQKGEVAINPATGAKWTADEIRAQRAANPHIGKRWSDKELQEKFHASDREIKAYREARAAIDQSLTDYAASEMGKLMRIAAAGLPGEQRVAADLALRTLARSGQSLDDNLHMMSTMLDAWPASKVTEDTRRRIKAIAGETKSLQAAGYSPLSRFGNWGVTGYDKEGKQAFFTMVNNKAEARALQLSLKGDKNLGEVTYAQMTKTELAAFKGMTPETAELFAAHNGLDKNEAVQMYLQQVVSSRSVLQRMQKRTGQAGFSNDATRILANFITGNARKSSGNVNLNDLNRAVADKGLTGGMKEEANKLAEYLQNPVEEAQTWRALLFANYLGGSIMSGLVNLTQPVLQTFPYLSQWGVAKAGAIMGSASKEAIQFMRGKDSSNAALQAALLLAKREGILDPNDTFQMQAAASQGAGSFGMQKFMRVWGLNFQLSESFNRATTFIAAYKMASENMTQEQLQKALNTTETVTPEDFAAHAIRETQGVYNKGNRPNWARGAVGSTIFTFKQFSISYIEFLRRMWGDGLIPKKQFVVAIATLMLAAGANGLPFIGNIDDILDSVGKLLGYNVNSKKWRRDFLEHAVGKDFAGALQDGVSHYLPFDLAGRVGAGNFIPGTKILDPTQNAAEKSKTMLSILGVGGSTLNNYLDAVGKLAEGNKRAAALDVMPVALQNLYKGYEMGTEHVYRDSAGRKVMDVTDMDAVMKAVGANPSKIARDSSNVSVAIADTKTQQWKQSTLNQEYARATANRDMDGMRKVIQQRDEWNAKNPDVPVKLSPASITNQVKAINSTRDERTIKGTPTSMRGAVADTLN